MKKNRIFTIITITILLSIGFQSLNSNVTAEFQKDTIENIEDWFTSSSLVNFTQDYKINLFFNIANDTLGYAIAPRLSFTTNMHVPLNFTSYLNKDVKDGTTEFGLQISSNPGNFTLGLNGTIIIVTPSTGPVYIDVKEGEIESFADFETLLGENITVPINFSPILFTVDDLEIPGLPELQSLGLELTPIVLLKGTIRLNAIVLGEELSWTDPDDIYFTEVPIEDKSIEFNTLVSNITLDFSNVKLSLIGFETAIHFGTSIGTIIQHFEYDFSSIEWIEGEQAIGDIFIFLVDSLFVINDMEVYISIEKTPFSILSILAAITLLSGLIYIRKKRRS